MKKNFDKYLNLQEIINNLFVEKRRKLKLELKLKAKTKENYGCFRPLELCYEVAPRWVFIERLTIIYIDFVWL